MRVIKVGEVEKAWPRQHTTPCCKSVLEIEPADIKHDTDYMGGHNSWYIDCPVCGKQPDVEDSMHWDAVRWEAQQQRIKQND